VVNQVFRLVEVNKQLYGVDVGQLLDYYGTGDDVPLDERLNKHDPLFQRVLEMD